MITDIVALLCVVAATMIAVRGAVSLVFASIVWFMVAVVLLSLLVVVIVSLSAHMALRYIPLDVPLIGGADEQQTYSFAKGVLISLGSPTITSVACTGMLVILAFAIDAVRRLWSDMHVILAHFALYQQPPVAGDDTRVRRDE